MRESNEQVAVPVTYKGLRIALAYRLDLVVERSMIVEVKAVDRLHPLIDAHVLTYFKLMGLRTGLILNFNVGLMRDGLRRLVL